MEGVTKATSCPAIVPSRPLETRSAVGTLRLVPPFPCLILEGSSVVISNKPQTFCKRGNGTRWSERTRSKSASVHPRWAFSALG